MDKEERDRLFNERVQEVKKAIPIKRYLTYSPKSGLYNCPFCGSGTKVNMTGAFEVFEDNTGYCHSCKNEAIGGKPADNIALEMNASNSDFMTAFSLLAKEAGISIDDLYAVEWTDADREGMKRMRERAKANATQENEKANAPQEAAGGPQSDFTGSDKETDTTGQKTPAGAADAPTEAETGAGANYTAYYKECYARITDPAAVEYIEGRGISIKTITENGLDVGFDPQADPANAPGGNGVIKYPIPRIIAATSPFHYIGRAITDTKYKKLNSKGSIPGIFNERAIYTQDAQEVFITEGLFDCLSVIEAGAAAIALNSAGNGKLVINQLKEKPTEKIFIVCFDNDPDAKTRAKIEKEKRDLMQGLQDAGAQCIEADICGIYGDANEYLQNDREGFIKAINEAQSAAEEATIEAKESGIDSLLSVIFTPKYRPQATGIYAIDKVTNGGFIPQTLILLGAEPGAGKTSLAAAIFENMATAGQPGIYFNLEMSREQLLARSIARRVYVNDNSHKLTALDVLQGYKQTEKTKELVLQAAQEYKEKVEPNLQYNPGETGADVTKILEYINATGKAAQEAGRPAPNICIDYLHILSGDPGEDTAAVIQRAVTGLKEYAASYNAIVLCIMAQSRAVNNRGEATLSAGRDTSAIEYAADLQLQLIRENKEDDNEITLHVTKSRFTETHMKDGVKFHFRGGQSYFEEFTDFEPVQGQTPFESQGRL